eukprot:3933992-Rhodomonas_salina.1
MLSAEVLNCTPMSKEGIQYVEEGVKLSCIVKTMDDIILLGENIERSYPLCNFAVCSKPINVFGEKYPSVENAYLAQLLATEEQRKWFQ